jgi:hypothetical protein
MQTPQKPKPLAPTESLLDVYQDVRIEPRRWPSPFLCVAVGDRRVADLLDAVGTPHIGDVMSELERA